MILSSGKWGDILIDEADFDLVKGYTWQTHKCRRRVYARAKQKEGGYIAIHRLLTRQSSYFVDHINGNGLDNRRENLRITTHMGNLHSFRDDEPKGYYKKDGVYMVNVTFNRHKYYLASCKNERDAANLYSRVRALLADAVAHNVAKEMENNKVPRG